jgi:WD40 repeat protein
VSEATDESPYLGLRSYDETDQSRYFGREVAVEELRRMVKRAPVTVLFGVSGIGKSSILRAGLFPRLRDDSYLPIYVRLVLAQNAPSFDEQLRQAVERELTARSVHVERRPAVGEALRTYFRSVPLWSERNRLLTPLVVFDQFEEIFTLGKARTADIERFMQQLSAMVGGAAADSEEDSSYEAVAPQPRLMLSLREDFLAHLEDHRRHMPQLAGNRFRLTRMNGEDALRSVREPAATIVSEATADKIVRFVAAGAKSVGAASDEPLNALEIEPALLSLVCSELDRSRRDQNLPAITDGLLAGQAGAIVDRFYERAFADQPEGMRTLVEEHLITPDGYRTTIAESAALELDLEGVEEMRINTLVDRRVLRRELRFGRPHIELMHDLLTRVALRGRAKRREQEANLARSEKLRKFMRYGALALGVLALVGAAVAYALIDRAARQAEQSEAREQSSQLAGILLEEGRKSLVRGEAASAGNLLLEARASYAKAKVEEPPPDLVLMLTRVVATVKGRSAVRHAPEITCAGLSPLGLSLVTCGRDGTFKAWRPDDSPGPGRSFGPPPSTTGVRVAMVNHAATWTLLVREDGSGGMWSWVDGRQMLQLEQSETNVTQQSAVPQRARVGTDWRACISEDDSTVAIWAPGVLGIRVWKIESDSSIDPVSVDLPELHLARPIALTCLSGGRVIASIQPPVLTGAVTRESPRVAVLGAPVEDELPREGRIVPGEIATLTSTDDGSVVIAISIVDGKPHTYAVRRDRETFVMIELAIPTDLVSLSLSKDGAFVVAVTGDQPEGSRRYLASVWSTEDATLRLALERSMTKAMFSTEGELIIVSEGAIEIWDPTQWKQREARSIEVMQEATAFDASVNGTDHVFVVAAGPIARVVSIDMLVKGPADRRLTYPIEEIPFAQLERGPGWPAAYAEVLPRVADELVHVRHPNPKTALELVARTDATTSISVATRPATLHPLTQPDRAPIVAARFAAGDDKRIAVLRVDGKVEIYDRDLVEDSTVGFRAAGARSIRWTEDGLLITIAPRRVEVRALDGTIRWSVETEAHDAYVVRSPDGSSVVWTCGPVSCEAWGLDSHRVLARLSGIPGRAEILAGGKTVLANGVVATLPPPSRNSDVVVDRGPVASIDQIGDASLINDERGNAAWIGFPTPGKSVPAVAGAAIVAVDEDGTRAAIAGREGVVAGSLFAFDTGNQVKLLDRGAPVTALAWDSSRMFMANGRASDARVAMVSAALDVNVVEADYGSRSPAVKLEGVRTAGAHATFSPDGRLFAVQNASGQIDVYSTGDERKKLGTYDLPASARLIDILLPNLDESMATLIGTWQFVPVVGALTADAVYVWLGHEGPSFYIVSRAYSEAVLTNGGKHLVALRPGEADIFRPRLGDLAPEPLRSVSAEAIAVDDSGKQLAVSVPKGRKSLPQTNVFELYGDDQLTKSDIPIHLVGLVGRAVFRPAGGAHLWFQEVHELAPVSAGANGVIPTGAPRDCVFSASGLHLICLVDIGNRSEVQVFDMKAAVATPVATEQLDRRADGLVSVAGDPNVIAVGVRRADESLVLTWNPKQLNDGPRKVTLSGRPLLRAADTENVWALWDDGLLQLWKLNGGLLESRGAARAAAISLGEGIVRVAVLTPGGTIKLFTVDSRKGKATSTDLDGSKGARSIQFVDRDTLVAIVPMRGADEGVYRWDLADASKARVAMADEAGKRISMLEIDRGFVGIGLTDGTTAVWPPGQGSAVKLERQQAAVRHFVVKDDHIATSAEDGTVRLWNMSGKSIATFGHPGSRNAPVVELTDAELISGASDGTVRVWDLKDEHLPTDEEIRRMVDSSLEAEAAVVK